MDQRKSSRVNTTLRQERLLRGWSQQDLANHLGTTIVTVNRWERGVQQPGPMFRLKLSKLFDKSEEELGLTSERSAIASVSSDRAEHKEISVNASDDEPGVTSEKNIIASGSSEMAEHKEVPVNLSDEERHEALSPEPVFLQDAPLSQQDAHTMPEALPEPANDASQNILITQTLHRLEELPYQTPTDLTRIKRSYLKYNRRSVVYMSMSIISLMLIMFLFLFRPTTFSPSHLPHSPSPLQQRAAGKLLYKAQWSKDRGGWIASSRWHWSDQDGGMITTDSQTNSLMFAPYQPSTPAYAVEASIQHLSYTSMEGNAYGIVVGRTLEKGEVCGVGVHEKPEHFFIGQLGTPTTQSQPTIAVDVFRSPVVLDTQWHAYRVEVTPGEIRFFWDSKPIAQVTNDNHIQGGEVGIYAVGTFISIRSFAVFAL